MIAPITYPEELIELDRWQRKDWNDRVTSYCQQGCMLTYHYKYNRLWRVGIWNADGSLRRYWYDRSARILLTLWCAKLPKCKNPCAPGAKESTLYRRLKKQVASRLKGRSKGGSKGETEEEDTLSK